MSSKRTATQIQYRSAKAQCTEYGSENLEDPARVSSPSNPHSSPAKAPPTPQRYGAAAAPSPSRKRERWYFDISYSEKDEAKTLGAKWDPEARQWYAASSIVHERLAGRFAQSTPPSQRKYFAVSFNDKDQAKQLGGRWDAAKKLWYAQDASVAEKMAAVFDAVDLEPLELEAAGEDRTFGGVNTLYIDLLPHSSHGKTLIKLLPDQEFARLKSFVITRAKGKCECCEANATVCHPRFHYNHHTYVQKLKRLMALCLDCKRSTHLGVAAINGEREDALSHLQEVMKYDTATLIHKEEAAWQDHYSRDDESWYIDLSLLHKVGLHPT